jgi:predicted nucleic acid-binding Zn finger protein
VLHQLCIFPLHNYRLNSTFCCKWADLKIVISNGIKIIKLLCAMWIHDKSSNQSKLQLKWRGKCGNKDELMKIMTTFNKLIIIGTWSNLIVKCSWCSCPVTKSNYDRSHKSDNVLMIDKVSQFPIRKGRIRYGISWLFYFSNTIRPKPATQRKYVDVNCQTSSITS